MDGSENTMTIFAVIGIVVTIWIAAGIIAGEINDIMENVTGKYHDR